MQNIIIYIQNYYTKMVNVFFILMVDDLLYKNGEMCDLKI